MSKLRVMVVSTSRADYGLLKPLIDKFSNDDYFQLTFVVTGSHLIDDQGYTIDLINKDNVIIDEQVSLGLENYSQKDSCKAISTGIPLFSEVITKHDPDTIVILGDRFELFSIAIPALIHNVPITHLHGGEASFGAIDDYIRHAVTKLSSVHFASTEVYRQRIIQMGENPNFVFNVGAIGIDNVVSQELMTIDELNNYTGIDFNETTALMTYHPVTIKDAEDSLQATENILSVLSGLGIQTIVTMPNIDSGSDQILSLIHLYMKKKGSRFKLIKSLGQVGYLSAMKYARFMIGNSSSGIIEAASFKLPVINVGIRQAGRIKSLNVLDTPITIPEIYTAIQKVLSNEFLSLISNIQNPYGKGDTANNILESLKNIDYKDKTRLLVKEFKDIKFNGSVDE